MSGVSRIPSEIKNVVSTSGFCSRVTPDDIEQQPLLDKGKAQKTPLPGFQLAVLCLVRLAEPIAYTQIFPYANSMVEELHVTDNPADIGLYSGLVDSLFAVAQLFTIFQWGRLSDRIGRQPVIITGLLGVATGSFCFGLSKSFYQMLAARAIAGALSGNSAVVSSLLSEITDKTNQAQGSFSLMGTSWYIGVIIGPLIGGTLSHPAERYPEIFGGCDFLKDKPYFLPCLISSLFTCFSIMVAYFFLEETLPSIVLEKKLKAASKVNSLPNPSASYGTLTPSATRVRPQEVSIRSPPMCVDKPGTEAIALSTVSLLLDERVRDALIAGFLLAFINLSYETVFVLWAYTPVSLGGLDRKPAEIGYALSSTGFLGIIIALFTFPVLHSRFGTSRIYIGSMCLWLMIFVLIPVAGWIAKTLNDRQNEMQAVIWICLVGIPGISRFAAMAFPANLIMVKSAAPNQESLGSTFGLAQSIACLARAIGPAFASSLFAISVDKKLLGGNLVYCPDIHCVVWGSGHDEGGGAA